MRCHPTKTRHSLQMVRLACLSRKPGVPKIRTKILFLSKTSTMAAVAGCVPLFKPWRSLAKGISMRGLLSAPHEVPMDLSVPERPCTLIYAQDDSFYASQKSMLPSWHNQFSNDFPSRFGTSYRHWSMSSSISSLDEALGELQTDLKASPDAASVVLVARGPWISWMAQFYLESLSLAGLVMVDPIQFDDQNGINQFELFYQKHDLINTKEYKLYQEFMEHYDHWTLRLEAGAAPMLVLHTMQRPAWKRAAENTALRHSTEDSNVPLLTLRNDHEAADAISTWIDNFVV